jgi:hypothetical protein
LLQSETLLGKLVCDARCGTPAHPQQQVQQRRGNPSGDPSGEHRERGERGERERF